MKVANYLCGRQGGHLSAQAADELSLPEAMGPSEHVRRVVRRVELVAPTDFTVLISGETGSGKELVAKAIHRLSGRKAAAFVPVDCGSIPPTLIESELFGHDKGSFTGAYRTRPGRFEAACGGTLFLDEISNMPLSVQPKLLRALQEKRICHVGGITSKKVDIRVVVASNQELVSLVGSGQFRRDLYHRLNEFNITVPPLRKRPEDIIHLARRFIAMTNEELGKAVAGLSETALELLVSHRWPGNVRELRNVIRRAVLMADTYIQPDHLSLPDQSHAVESLQLDPAKELAKSTPLKEIVRRVVMQVEREVLTHILRRTNGNKAKAARILQIDYKTIHKKVKEYGII